MNIERLSTNFKISDITSAQYQNKPVRNKDLEGKNKLENKDPYQGVASKNQREHYTEDEVIKMIENANEEFTAYDRRFEFSVHEKTKKISVKILDSNTDEVIRELPPEKILDMIAGIWEVAGILVDKKI